MDLYGKPNIEHEIKLHSSHEKQKATGGSGRERKRKFAINLFRKEFPDAKKVLCIGSRTYREPETFIKSGFDCVGIDVCKEDKYVKKIDAHYLLDHFVENEFDIAYACHSFEHLHDPHTAFKGIRSVVRHGIFFVLPLGFGARITEDHACLYDIMKHKNHSMDKLNQNPQLLDDFKHLGPFEVFHVGEKWLKNKKKEGELEIGLRFT